MQTVLIAECWSTDWNSRGEAINAQPMSPSGRRLTLGVCTPLIVSAAVISSNLILRHYPWRLRLLITEMGIFVIVGV